MDYVIIVAGGKGLRMGSDIPKQFLPLGGKPVLMRTLERFREYSETLRIILVLPEAQQDYWRRLCEDYHFDVDYQLANGGETRFHSVQNGLALIPDDAGGVVGVHDGVRPFPSIDVIRCCFETAREMKAVIPVIPVVETLRHVENEELRMKNEGNEELRMKNEEFATALPTSAGNLSSAGGKTTSAAANSSLFTLHSSLSRTVPRSEYRLVQTPQTFDIQLLKAANRQPYNDGFTDDASVVEAFGHEITLVEGNRENIKITTPYDMKIAEVLI